MLLAVGSASHGLTARKRSHGLRESKSRRLQTNGSSLREATSLALCPTAVSGGPKPSHLITEPHSSLQCETTEFTVPPGFYVGIVSPR